MVETSWLAITVFAAFVAITLGLSFYLGRRAKSSAGYFAAHGEIPWFINGVAFAGDYLSAASFLGICGMIATFGYDGFLYSIGYLAGWVVALFVIAEPMKRLGRFTFADAFDAKYRSPGIKLAAGISTLVVSLFYLIPQMVGAGVLVQPLLGLPHWAGVVLVGTTVILIVVTAGMVSTTWVQFIKGTLLVVFSGILTLMLLSRGFQVSEGGVDGYRFAKFDSLPSSSLVPGGVLGPDAWKILNADSGWENSGFLRVQDGTQERVFSVHSREDSPGLVDVREAQVISIDKDGVTLINGQPKSTGKTENKLHPVGFLSKLPDGKSQTGSLGPIEFIRVLQNSEVVLWGSKEVKHPDGGKTTVYFQKPTSGSRVLRPGEHPMFAGIRSGTLLDFEAFKKRIDFISLMLALFCGTASLPHILIRYYTVRDESAARKSTIVGIASIGLFYVLTLYLGLGAMTSGTMDITNNNMAAPLLAKSISLWLFAIISAIAFTTVLGTVSGLILAASGAVTHDLLCSYLRFELTEHQQVRIAKIASVGIGVAAIVLGILFEKLNVTYLVGWAFSVAASANLPALVMLLFWKGTTRQGVIASVVVGMVSSLTWIMFSTDAYQHIYKLAAADAPMPFSQPGIVTIPLSFVTLIVVSWMSTGRPRGASSGNS